MAPFYGFQLITPLNRVSLFKSTAKIIYCKSLHRFIWFFWDLLQLQHEERVIILDWHLIRVCHLRLGGM